MILNKIVYCNLINLRNASIARKSFIDSNYNLLLLNLLDLFYKQGYINGYYYLTKYKIRIFFKYVNNLNFFDKINFKLNKINFSYKSLIYLFYKSYLHPNYLYYFSTKYGFFTLEEIFFKNLFCGGLLYFYIKF